MKTIFFLCIGLLAPSTSFSYLQNSGTDQFAGKSSMNGYEYRGFVGFDKKWKLVTVRFRVDTGELRFTYANPIAWKTMMRGRSDYPDGSIFGKVGYITDDDPAFTSSKVPSGARRFQFMVKDKKKHKNHDGWGYVLFDGTGKTFPEDPAVKIESCVACHRTVPDRGFVFSQPMNPSEAIKAIRAKYKETNGLRFTYDKISNETITGALKDFLGTHKEINLLNGPLRKSIFQGTLDEITPTLMEIAEETNLPTALASENFNRFTLVTFVKRRCLTGHGFQVDQTQLETTADSKLKVKTSFICKP